ncbi:MAG: MarR family transcriptional regulator [Gammaproteobacteria bacterium]|nr:MarR family transcriptional regulator [Gammaproteobacteria bacterium]
MYDDLRKCANMNLRRTARLVGQFYEQHLQPTGLRATQFTLLAAIGQTGPVSISSLAGKMDLERTTLTRNVHLLEREKLIAIREGEDARTRLLALTPKGESRLQGALPYWERAQTEFLERFGNQHWEQMLTELEALSKSVAPD